MFKIKKFSELTGLTVQYEHYNITMKLNCLLQRGIIMGTECILQKT